MSYTPTYDLALEVPRGNIADLTFVNKFGRQTDIDTLLQDVFDDGTNVIWDAPTTARTHDIAGAAGDSSPSGGGARTIRIWGLTAWDADEVSEDITMNGTTNVATANQYVIIHRMSVLTSGATGINIGNITATAQTDGTVTAQINTLQGQTQMAIYGIPSTKVGYMTLYYASMNRGVAAAAVDINLVVNSDPENNLTNFIQKHTRGMQSDGTSEFQHRFNPYFRIPGPAIIKLQAQATANNNDVSAGFDLYLEAA